MTGERNEQPGNQRETGAPWRALACATPLLALLLAGCGTSLSSLNLLDSNKATSDGQAESGNVGNLSNEDVDCPPVQVRTGAATLMIGGAGKPDEPAALNLRYQGTIIRYARECHINAGVMTMRVGIEGRVITGPAGGPGKVDVPLRIAVVQEGVTPKAISSKFVIVPVEITSAVDRVTFTHIEEGMTFPMPTPAGLLDSYVVYIGFDTLAAQQQKKPAPRKRR
ncbi:hypothetical protein [Pseudolabrys sp. Root1462]|uniref:hypothetical protein n=1 Tax=Pseudolabrys sp. Root1462 TaxID=1736466 RepID=UPI0012E3B1DD|nr:hypothetical protein [Pseudolabrys sp. Root1462]